MKNEPLLFHIMLKQGIKWFSQQIKLETEWNEKMEHLNEKYNLDYYSSSESDSDFEPEHKYETHIKSFSIFSIKYHRICFEVKLC